MNELAPPLCYGSVCSGIEAVSLAWRPLGLMPAWFAEIDSFANAVLTHHYPEVLNLGDMTQIAPQILSGSVCAPDILVGGTPCQSFSVAGMRKGFADPRGALTLKYVELANAIDEIRIQKHQPPTTLVWENVPGVLSDCANAFGSLLGALSGEECELLPAGKRWAHAGCVYGPQRAIAWRVLDAQYFGVAQRRKRVFLVASARKDFDPAAVLFESDGLRRDTAPCSQTSEALTSVAAPGAAHACRISEASHAAAEEAVSVCFGGGNASGSIDRAACLTARGHKDDFEIETFAVQAMSGPITPPLTGATAVTENGWGRGVPIVGLEGATHLVETITGRVTHALNTANNGKGSSEDGSGRGVPIISVSYQLHAGDAFAFAQNSRGEVRFEGGAGQLVGALSTGGGIPGQGVPTIASAAHPQAVPSFEAHLQCQRFTSAERARAPWQEWRVRRLMPKECERLQGLPDDYTLVLYRGKAASDGPRYKAIGNSMAIPCVAWIGKRLIRAMQMQRRCMPTWT